MEKYKEIIMPKFLLAEEPKGGDFTFIYSPHYVSLILIVPEDDATVLLNAENRKRPHKSFNYKNETFEFIIVQNNLEAVGEMNGYPITADKFLTDAWEWYSDYLRYEDEQINTVFN